ncbi:MAG: 23S rRNA (pseudouridine(1915)-N(3))-methyltransferase RlmH [Firmicutes bacterium]|nr:23S rRNA (pseudouridine(1915)-N(3))-methyltransferase RlmH [Bacillota bacterium]
MKITIISETKIQNKYTKEAIKEYTKRLGAFAKVNHLITSNPEKDIPKNAYVIQIDENGESISSEELAQKIDNLAVHGHSHIVFLLETSSSISSDFSLAISQMDMDSDILSIVLYEQIYRAFTIIHNRTYHK